MREKREKQKGSGKERKKEKGEECIGFIMYNQANNNNPRIHNKTQYNKTTTRETSELKDKLKDKIHTKARGNWFGLNGVD